MIGFGRLLRAEWTKLRTVPGWVIGLLAGPAVIVALGLFPGAQGSCGQHGPESDCVVPVGPGGEEVSDSFFFAHRSVSGDGSLTVRVAGLTGVLPAEPKGSPFDNLGAGGGSGAGPVTGGAPTGRPGVIAWAKVGLMIKDGLRPGSSYAAVMLTGAHGVRMQYDYTGDLAGPAGAAPNWLRLTRSGTSITGSTSVDGTQWTNVGTVRLDGLPATVQIGLFATSPQYAAPANAPLGLSGVETGPTRATGTFDHIGQSAGWTGEDWTGTRIGGPGNESPEFLGGFKPTGDGFAVTGSGDIAPAVAGATGLGTSISQTLAGTFIGLIVVVVIATMFVTAEYRRGLIRTTLAASPQRARILAAKATVIGAVTFVGGLVAAAIVVRFGPAVLRDNGAYVHPASLGTEVRVVIGTAALLAGAAVLAVGLGALLRRGTTAVTTAIVVIVLPYLLALTVLPLGAARWLLRITPAAAFALQQASAQYPQVDNLYTPSDGYYPLLPWAGFAVLLGWVAVGLGLAVLAFRRRDA